MLYHTPLDHFEGTSIVRLIQQVLVVLPVLLHVLLERVDLLDAPVTTELEHHEEPERHRPRRRGPHIVAPLEGPVLAKGLRPRAVPIEVLVRLNLLPLQKLEEILSTCRMCDQPITLPEVRHTHVRQVQPVVGHAQPSLCRSSMVRRSSSSFRSSMS